MWQQTQIETHQNYRYLLVSRDSGPKFLVHFLHLKDWYTNHQSSKHQTDPTAQFVQKFLSYGLLLKTPETVSSSKLILKGAATAF